LVGLGRWWVDHPSKTQAGEKEAKDMTDQEKQRKIEHYKYMLETMELNPRHRYWIEDQLADLEGK
jgi:hypothetical protein